MTLRVSLVDSVTGDDATGITIKLPQFLVTNSLQRGSSVLPLFRPLLCSVWSHGLNHLLNLLRVRHCTTRRLKSLPYLRVVLASSSCSRPSSCLRRILCWPELCVRKLFSHRVPRHEFSRQINRHRFDLTTIVPNPTFSSSNRDATTAPSNSWLLCTTCERLRTIYSTLIAIDCGAL